jgi:hypothetical protein
MSPKTPDPETFLPLTPAVLNILLALAEGEKHGYAIMQDVELITDGQMTMGPGTLYGAIACWRFPWSPRATSGLALQSTTSAAAIIG